MPLQYADLIGKPFAYNARGPEQYDCYGLLMELMRRMGQTPPPDLVSPSNAHRIAAYMAAQLPQCWERIDHPEPGCAILLRIKSLPSHCAIYLGDGKFIHTWEESNGVCTEHLSDWEYQRRVEGYYRHVVR